MSHLYKKIPYVTQGAYGSTEHKMLFVHFNNTCDTVSFYTENGEYLFSYDEWGLGEELDLGQAIVKAITSGNDDLEYMTPEERELIK